MFKAYQNIDISTTPSPSLTLQDIQSNIEGYRCVGSGTNFTLTLTGSPLINMATFLLWEASASGTVTIFGTVMPTEFKTKKTLVTCTYDGSAWKVVFNISGDESGYIVNANVATNAAIARTKIASGSNNHVVINDGSGNLSSEALLANTRGGTGRNMSADTGVVKVSSGTFSASSIVNADISNSAAIAYSKLATLNTGQILIGNAGVPTAATMSGDATIDNTGVVTIPNLMFEVGAGSDSLKDKRANTSSGDFGQAIGEGAVNSGNSGQAIGRAASNSNNSGQAIGANAANSGLNGQSIGYLANNSGEEGAGIGFLSTNSGLRGQAIGNTASNEAEDGQAIGNFSANSGIKGNSIGYLSVNRRDKCTNISGPITIRKGDSAGDTDEFLYYAGSEVIIMTGTFDAKTLGTQTISFPTGVRMFVDEVGFIATTANTVTGQPTISYGISGNNTALLAATATTGVTSAGARDRQTSLVTDNGVTSLTCEVTAAAVATTLVGRAYFKGFIVENQ